MNREHRLIIEEVMEKEKEVSIQRMNKESTIQEMLSCGASEAQCKNQIEISKIVLPID